MIRVKSNYLNAYSSKKKALIFLYIFIFFLLFSYSVHSQSTTFNFTGSVQTWTVPAGVTSVDLTVAGAKGGGSNGGNGAIITKNCFTVTPGQTLNIYCGGMGTSGNNSGGFNGGGTGHASTNGNVNYNAWGGGGASDIRIGGNALANRVIVAGGGGGRSGGSNPACGGAANCNNGAQGCNSQWAGGGFGGTQTAGGAGGIPWAGTPPGGAPGALGVGGAAGPWQTASGGGGGGGYYGGGGGGNDGCCTGANGGGGGGGGSSFVPAGGTCVAGGNGSNGYVTITVSTLLGVSASNTGPYCPNQTIQLNATGGGTYAWSGPNGFTSNLQNPTIPNMTAANAGTYTVTVTNSGCSSSATTIVALNNGATVNLVPTNAACASATNGSINVTATGSTPGYNVSWTGPSTGNPAGTEISTSGGNYNILNLGVGTYTVTVTASNLCATTATTTINANQGVTGSATFVPPLCNGSSNGSITVSANLGIAPYQVSWIGPTTGNPSGNEITSANGTYQITSVAAGSYTVTITDATGCFYSFPVSVTQPNSLTASSTMTSVLCNGGSTGSLIGMATGGTAPYNMSWTGPNTGNPPGDEINADGGSYTVNGAPAGSYVITMTDGNGCTATATTTIIEPLVLNTSAISTAALCSGSSDGTITVTATNGTAPYNVSWTGQSAGDPVGNEISSSNGTYQIPSVAAGNYTITVTDANGCTAQTTSVVSQPVSLSASSTNTATLCNGSSDGTITVTATAGTASYNVSWTGPLTGNPTGDEITGSGGTYTINGVCAGTYTITVTDANGCITTTNSIITQPTGVIASATNVAVLCNGGSTGSVTGIASGGTAPYDMSWAGPNAGDPAGDEISADGGSYTVNGAPAGSYVITMTDDNGCEGVTTTEIMEPEALSASAINTAVLCYGASSGTVEGTATGGIAPYNMSWTGPNTGNPPGDEINADGGSYTVNGAPAGSYVITMTDGNGCSATATTTIIEPAILQINATPVPPLCNGVFNGSMDITANGGTAPYDVSWSGPNSDDPVGTEIFNNGDLYTISGVGAGTYVVILTDANLCTSTTTITLVPPVVLTIATQVTNVACFNGNTGSIQVIANDGLPSYNVSWFGATSGDPIGSEINSSGGNYVISNLSSGSYTVYVSDINGCIDSSIVQIIEPTELIQQQIITPTLCQSSTDGAVNFTVSGGTPSYNIELIGSVSSNPLGDEINLSGGSFTFSNLAVGSYTATITDNNNCIVTIPVIVSVGQNPPVITLLNDTICSGQATTLSPSVLPSGGTFLWGNSSTNAAITVSPTTTTQYGVVYNYIGCYVQANALVVVNPIPTLSISDEIICEGESATLVPSGLQPTGGTFLWSTNSSDQTITVSPSVTSNYFVTYTANGCSSTPANAIITVNPIPSLVINNAAICSGQSATLTAVPTILGGSIVWSPTNATTTSINVSPTVNTTYSAIYTLNNCSSESVSAEVSVIEIPSVTFTADTTSGCDPAPILLWNTSPNNIQNSSLQWTINGVPVATSDTLSYTFGPGCFDIGFNITASGCTGQATYQDFICVDPIPSAAFVATPNFFSQPNQTIAFQNSSQGAVTYIWNTGDGTNYFSENISHTFSETADGYTVGLTAISELGCMDSTYYTLPYTEGIIFFIPNTFTPDGNNFNNMFLPIFSSVIDPQSYELAIYNRWGELIFKSFNLEMGWDGSYGNFGIDCPAGTYIYTMMFKIPTENNAKVFSGHVNLLR